MAEDLDCHTGAGRSGPDRLSDERRSASVGQAGAASVLVLRRADRWWRDLHERDLRRFASPAAALSLPYVAVLKPGEVPEPLPAECATVLPVRAHRVCDLRLGSWLDLQRAH